VSCKRKTVNSIFSVEAWPSCNLEKKKDCEQAWLEMSHLIFFGTKYYYYRYP